MIQPAEVNLSGVPETMLWTLYNRASEAQRSDGALSTNPEDVLCGCSATGPIHHP